jgi:hypothetical protein
MRYPQNFSFTHSHAILGSARTLKCAWRLTWRRPCWKARMRTKQMRCSCPQSQLRMSSAWQRALDGALLGNAQSHTSGAQEQHCLPSLTCTAMRDCEGCPENMSSARLIALRGALSEVYSHAHEARTFIIASPSLICAAVRHLGGVHSAGCLCCAVWDLMAANFL